MFFPFRKGEAKEPDWTVMIKYIKQHFPSNYNSQIQGAVDRLGQYKKVIAATCTNELKQPPNEAFIEQTLKSYIQLISTAQAHLPLSGVSMKGLAVEWRDSLDESHKHQSKNSNVEVFSCLHNLSSAYAYIASVDAESGTVDGVKNAFKTYQAAAGCFQFAEGFLRRLPPACVVKDATVESQQLFQKLCMCQAHHCSYLKAELEMKGKHALLSKMAVEGGRLYDDASKTIAAQGWARTPVVKDLELYSSNMSLVFYARGHLHIAQERMDAGEVGDAIARYNFANQSIQRTTKFSNGNMNGWLQGIKGTILELHQKAVSANETVYFLRIPKELPPLEGLGKGIGKPTPAPSLTKVISNRDADPFFGIVPAHVSEVASKHFSSMQVLTTSASKSVSSYRGRMHTALNALGVTGTIESLSSESKDRGRIPEPLRSKILAMRPEEGGNLADGLVNRVTQSEEVLDACTARVREIQTLLMQEQQDDDNLATQYGTTLWRGYRPPSILAPHSQDIHKLLHQQEEQIAKSVKQQIDRTKATLSASLKDLSRLDWPLDDLDGLMPYTKTKAVKEQTKVVMDNVEKLQKFVLRFDQVDEQNNAKLKELNALMQSDTVVHTLSAVDADQHEAILDAAANEIKDIVSCIQSNISSGEALLEGVEEIMNNLAVTRSEDPISVEIQQVCSMIESALDLYHRLDQDVSEIDTSASQALEHLDGILSSTQSFVLSRQLEADDIKADIEGQIAVKVKEMEAKKGADASVVESQKRQDALRAELEQLEQQRLASQQARSSRQQETAAIQHTLATTSAEVDNRNERMQQLLNRQRDAAQQMQGGHATPYAPPPSYAYQPPPQAGGVASQHGYAPQPAPHHYHYQAPPQQEQHHHQQQQYHHPPFGAQPMQGSPQFGGPQEAHPAPPPGPPPPYLAQLPHPSNFYYQAPPQ